MKHFYTTLQKFAFRDPLFSCRYNLLSRSFLNRRVILNLLRHQHVTSSSVSSTSPTSSKTSKDNNNHESQLNSTQYVEQLFTRLCRGEKASLAQGITLVESTNPQKKKDGQVLLSKALQHIKDLEKHTLSPITSFRIGISGPPGAGKSTFIETFGKHLTGLGYKVAVLPVDPSSKITGL